MKQNKKQQKVSTRASMYMRFLHQEAGVTVKEIKRRFPQYKVRSIYRHAKSKQTLDPTDQRKTNKGRPRKLTVRDERAMIRAVHRLRKETSSFTAKRAQEEAQLTHVSAKTFRRALVRHGYRYLQSRKKGLLTPEDKKKRVVFARNASQFKKDFWKNDIKFYFDGVGFAHKFNPYSEARATDTMAWRKPNEGLSRSTKGKKEGSGGNMANFFVAISYRKGVVLCKQYPWTVTGERFASFVTGCFPSTFVKCGAEVQGSLFLQDGDPRQTSKAAKNAWEALGCSMFAIPARSPDLNPIENIFHLVRKQLKKDALEQQISKKAMLSFLKE